MRVGIACGLLSSVIWGLLQVSGRVAVVQGLSPFDLAALRFGVAGLLLLPWLLANSRRPFDLANVGWRKAVALTICLGPPFFLINMGAYLFAPLAHGVVVLPAAFIVAGLLGGYYFFDQPITRARAAGSGVVVCGLAMIAGSGLLEAGGLTPLGDVMFAIAGLMWCFASVLMNRWRLSPIQTTASVAVLSAALYLPAYAIFGTPQNLASAPATVLLFHVLASGVLAGVVAMLAFSRSVEILGAGGAAIFPALVPVMGTLIGYVMLGETPGPTQIVGLVLVSIGLLLAVR